MSCKSPAVITRLLLVIVVVALSGCATLTPTDFTLLTSSSDQQLRVAQQQWLVHQGEKDYSLEVIVERSGSHWRWIMLNQLGQRLITAESKAGKVEVERHQAHPVNALVPAFLQAWQLGYWPLADLQRANPEWLLVERDGLREGRREERFSDILRASVDYRQLADRANPWLGSLGYTTNEFSLLIHSQPLN